MRKDNAELEATMTHDEIDNRMNDVFADARPGGGLEDRVIAGVRKVHLPRLNLHPMVRRAALGVAAAVMLGGVGFAVTQPALQSMRMRTASNLRQIGQSAQVYSNDSKAQLNQDVAAG